MTPIISFKEGKNESGLQPFFLYVTLIINKTDMVPEVKPPTKSKLIMY